MKIFLTYDYELFFGKPTGTAEKSILEPTKLLINLAEKTGIKMVFFIDVGYLKKMAEFKAEFPQLEKDYQNVSSQIQTLVQKGHDCQLHIHPHWEDCTYTNQGWQMVTNRYKLVDFEEDEIERIVLEYKDILHKLTGKAVHSYRAGGWCLQPFSKVRKALKKAGIRLDSTVFRGGKFTAGNYYYDFTSIPESSTWSFDEDLCKEDSNGSFVEYPIANHQYSPLFFWRLFALGRLNPAAHKPMGDGYPMPSPGLRKTMLTKGKNLSASVDGYFVTKLPRILKDSERKGYNEMVIIGHPKATTKFALNKLEDFIRTNKNKHEFCTFADCISTL